MCEIQYGIGAFFDIFVKTFTMSRVCTIFSLFILILLISCGPSQEERGRARLNFARALLQQNDTVDALLHLDSIATLLPKATFAINAAKNLKKELLWEILQQKGNQLDTIKIRISELERNFNTEKTLFDRFTQYLHKRQTWERSWNRSYIQILLNERGDLSLVSNYNGTEWLNHTGLRVYDQGLSARTDSVGIGEVDNHRSDFLESKWEKVTYRNGRDNGVIEFIAENAHLRLKAVFLGRRLHFIVLEDFDKKAVQDALALSKAIKYRNQLEADIKQLQGSLNALN
jgi:hypothetical protein